MSILSKIADIERELAHTQKNKATEFHIGLLKGKLARYRAELMEFQKKAAGGGGGGGASFEVSKTGDARVAFVGFPSVGKSSLLNVLTDSKSCIASYDFTTLTCVPGLLQMHGARIQLLDLPGIIRGASEGRGRGKQVIATARTADLIIMVIDAAGHPNQVKHLTYELDAMGIRLNKKKPNVSLRVKTAGGVVFTSSCPLTHLNYDLIVSIFHDYKIWHAEICFHEDSNIDDLIDLIELSRNPTAIVYVPCLYVFNKVDQISMEEIDMLAHAPHSVVISCEKQLNMDGLLTAMWEELCLIRLYTKHHSQPPDLGVALVVKRGATVDDVCHRIHRNLSNILKHAVIWGTSTKYNPMRVGKEHVVHDEDVIEIVKKIV